MTQKYFQNTQLLLIYADNPLEGATIIVMMLHIRQAAFLWVILCTVSAPAQAGVFESIHPVIAKPVRWTDPLAIPYSIDEGNLGQLNRQQASDLIEAMMAVWENEGGGAFHFVDQGSIGADVTAVNLKEYVDNSVCTDTIPPKITSMIKGQSPIIFDTDGSIIDALSEEGSSRKIVGKAAFRCFKGTLSDPQGVTQAFLIMNGRFMDGLPDPVDLPINAFAGVILHELGHYLGLHHSMVNEEIYAGVLNGINAAEDSKYIPVMYPLILPNSAASTVLKPDDRAILRELYPASSDILLDISGTILSSDGLPVKSANVVARRVDDPLCQAVSGISGRECTPMVSGNGLPSVLSENCSSAQLYGDYVVHGLPAGQYTLEVSEIVEQGGARQNMFPKGAGQDLPGEPMILAQPLSLNGDDVHNIDFDLPRAAAAHQTGIDQTLFLRAAKSDCKTDPVNYKEFVSLGDAAPADSSSSIAFPANDAQAAGCSLIR